MNGDKITFLTEDIQFYNFHIVQFIVILIDVRIKAKDINFERVKTFDDLRPNFSKTNNTDGFVSQFCSDKFLTLPLSVEHGVVALMNIASQGQNEGNCMLRR